MKKKCYLFVFDGFSDWEASYACVGISKSENFELHTLALEKSAVRTMGGLTILPEYDFIPEVDLQDMHPSNTGLVILPGGTAWERKSNNGIKPLVAHCLSQGIPVAAICGATILLADLGILNDIPHTSNELEYLRHFSPEYVGEESYRFYPAVAADQIITASGSGAVEFAREIFDVLDMGSQESVRSWFHNMDKVTVS